MVMYPFRKLYAHVGHISTVQFVLGFQSATYWLESLPCGYGFGPQQSLKKLSRVLILTGNLCYSPFGKEKGSNRFRI